MPASPPARMACSAAVAADKVKAQTDTSATARSAWRKPDIEDSRQQTLGADARARKPLHRGPNVIRPSYVWYPELCVIRTRRARSSGSDVCRSGSPMDKSRRHFMQSAAAAAALGQVPPTSAQAPMPETGAAVPAGTGTQSVILSINGRPYTLTIEPRVTLLDALREQIGLTGTKKGCDRGQCGACTVLVNGRRINACLTLAMAHQGDEITTIEGLA